MCDHHRINTFANNRCSRDMTGANNRSAKPEVELSGYYCLLKTTPSTVLKCNARAQRCRVRGRVPSVILFSMSPNRHFHCLRVCMSLHQIVSCSAHTVLSFRLHFMICTRTELCIHHKTPKHVLLQSRLLSWQESSLNL